MKKRGFTLIELLAVIIILGILLLIAIPGVTGYINNSRKNVYVDTAKELVKGTSKLLNSGDFDTLDEDVTYYMDSRCIANESGKEAQSPFGKFNPAYVLVVNEKDNYNYYFQSRDETEVGVKDITSMDSLEISKIVSNVKEEDIDTSVAVGNTTKVALIDEKCHVGETRVASRRVSKDGESMITLTFDNQGGTGCDMQSQYYGEEWGKLCKPKKEGLKFNGWYTKENKLGDKITKNSKAEESMTVYAAWTDQYATFDYGMSVNSKLKQLSGQDNASYFSDNTSIIYIKWSEDEPIEANKQEVNKISTSNSALPIYAWFDTDTIYIWSIYEEPYLNENSSYMFANFKNVISIDISESLNTSNVTDMSVMFKYCRSLRTLNLDNFDTSKVNSLDSFFAFDEQLTSIDLDGWDTSNVTNLSGMFQWCLALRDVDLSVLDTSSVTTTYYMFYNAQGITSINFDNWNTSNCTNMNHMFTGCRALLSLDLSSFDTSNVTTMENMFSCCWEIRNIDISSFDTSNVTNMGWMFYCCNKLIELDLSNFNTSNVTTMSRLFYACYLIDELDLSSFDTSNVTSFYEMFRFCTRIKHLDLTNFNTSKVTSVALLFSGMNSVETIDISSFDVSNVTSCEWMFLDCNQLKTVYVNNNFELPSGIPSTNIFYYCISLVGGNGTTWDYSMTHDMSYARVDGKDGLPGLFTLKT